MQYRFHPFFHTCGRLIFWIIIGFSVSCRQGEHRHFRGDFTPDERKVLSAGRALLNQQEYLTLVTIDDEGQPRARVMEFIKPDEQFGIWMGTNPKSRKVEQIRRNSTATVHCFDPGKLAYISLMGNAYIENSDSLKRVKWKEGWERFYPDRKKDFILIRFVPHTLEYIGIVEGYTGDPETWAPHQVKLMTEFPN